MIIYTVNRHLKISVESDSGHGAYQRDSNTPWSNSGNLGNLHGNKYAYPNRKRHFRD